jgi:erythromycin esterase-like protein
MRALESLPISWQDRGWSARSGVIYRPESELASHYFEAVLPQQFDEYIWIDRTNAVKPLDVAELQGLPDTYPFGL